jgi:non-reducing end alpha-L-arabinofuranosidase
MNQPIRFRLPRKSALGVSAVMALVIGVFTVAPGAAAQSPTAASSAASAPQLPCDVYQADGTPCVGAYSTVRALYAAYDGPLYQVTRTSDNTSITVVPLAAGGFANVAPQQQLCASASCVISGIYDQSPKHNNLTVEGPGAAGGQDVGAAAGALPVTVAGHPVYGVKITPGTGYRDNAATGVAVNGEPETMYEVTSSTYVNNKCCMDFGNTETSNNDNGNGHMDAVSYSTRCAKFSPCYGAGPWVQADLENGLFQSSMGYSENTLNTGLNLPFVTALLKNNGQNYFALKVGNAQSGSLTTNYAGLLPTIQGGGYSPMQQEGGIVLGTGGDNSNAGSGYFYEGVITAGLSTDTADDAVQASIVAADY